VRWTHAAGMSYTGLLRVYFFLSFFLFFFLRPFLFSYDLQAARACLFVSWPVARRRTAS
jgi:hypothetical protein